MSVHLSLTRLVAAQVLYQYDFHQQKKDIKIITDELLNNYVLDEDHEQITPYKDKIDQKLLNNLLDGSALILPGLDEEISVFLKGNWEINKLPDMMLTLLRLGVFELKFMTATPLKVVINEYVDLAACFYEPQKITFVNSILENIAKKLRPEEFKKIKNA